MSLNDKFETLRTIFYDIVEIFFQKVASLFGYPENKGMLFTDPIYLNDPSNIRLKFLNDLPSHSGSWPTSRAETWFEIIFGPIPRLELIEKHKYENLEEGFYNFYIQNYKNLYFLPDWLSEFLQVKCHICLNTTVLDNTREILFVGFIIYAQLIALRITISWFISLNPYRSPWYYLTGAVDWTEEILHGVVPTILGLNLTVNIFAIMLGIATDSLNHLVFTMPYLPSEGEQGEILIGQQIKNVLIFHNLPFLWYHYPIPDEVRTLWYEKSPEILDYMEETYKDLNIQFLPDKEEYYHQLKQLLK